MKKCNKCKEEKELKEFTLDKRSKDGKYGICKPCSRKANAKWRKKYMISLDYIGRKNRKITGISNLKARPQNRVSG